MGPVIGAIVLTILPDLLRFAGDYRMVLYGLIVLAIAVIFPRGIEGIWAAMSQRSRENKPILAHRVERG